jgi:hypothetical protein
MKLRPPTIKDHERTGRQGPGGSLRTRYGEHKYINLLIMLHSQ